MCCLHLSEDIEVLIQVCDVVVQASDCSATTLSSLGYCHLQYLIKDIKKVV